MKKRIFNRKKLEERRKELRNDGTAAEAVLWDLLKNGQLLGKKFRRQESIGPYIVDFYRPECCVVVELDGAAQDPFLTWEYEARRDKYLKQLGITVLRFENRVLYENPEAILETIKRTLLNLS